MKLRTIKNIKNLSGKRVLLRVDFNVGIKNRKVADGAKIKAALPTINYLLKKNAKVILISHLGRPTESKVKSQKSIKSKVYKVKSQKSVVGKFSLRPIVKNLEKLLGLKVKFINDCIGGKVKNEINKMNNGEVVLLENLRFYKEEMKNSKRFAKNLASFADYYINDAFAVSHRAHSSLVAITDYLPSYSGFLIEKEMKNLSVLFNPNKPYIVLLGGAKLKTKISLIKVLCKKADKILIGGAIANQFLKIQGYEIGKSLIEKNITSMSLRGGDSRRSNLMTIAPDNKIILPKDVIVAKKISGKAEAKKISDVSKNDIILDIGPETTREYAKILKSAKTILWNGPMGIFELKKFSSGSLAMAMAVAAYSRNAFTVCGGGETIAVLNQVKIKNRIDLISTGGGAMLTYLTGEELPGIKPLL